MPPRVKIEENLQNQGDDVSNNNGSDNSSNNISLTAQLGIPLTNASSTTSGSTDFVKKLFLMLEDNSYDKIVRWTAKGDSFVVLDTNEFTKEILPRHFKHSNFASFVRQLNKYDFHKVKQSNEEKQLNEYGEGAWEFKHPDFRRHDRVALETIKRKGPAQKRGTEDHSSQETINRLEDNVSKLTNDSKILFDELKLMNSKYTNVIESIITLKNTNDRYFRSINTLVNCLVQNGIKLPQLDLPPLDSPIIQQQPTSQTPHQQHKNGITPSSQVLNIQQPQPQQPHHPPLQRSSNSQPSSQQLPVQQQHQQPPPPQQGSQGGPQGGPPQQPGGPPPQIQPPGPAGSQQPQPHQPGPMPDRNHSQTSTPPLILRPGFNVLLVEDDNVCIQLCRKFLMKYGCTVEVVTDGLTAITALETSRYDIVLMDIVMPNLDGATATSIVRSFDSETPIIAMTGNINENDLVAYLQHGMSDILAKPFTKDDLYLMLQKYLSTRIPLSYQQPGSAPPPPPQGPIGSVGPPHGSLSSSVSPGENEPINKKQKV